jgi:hypothetical protein
MILWVLLKFAAAAPHLGAAPLCCRCPTAHKLGTPPPAVTGGRGSARPFEVCTSCPEDVFDNTSPDLRVPQLPWRLQEDWGCERVASEADVLVAENEYLRAAITPR